jgi:uncharacterized protein YjbJ (UPF0337 family)
MSGGLRGRRAAPRFVRGARLVDRQLGDNDAEELLRKRRADVPNKDEAEGRIKEAAGDLTGDKHLQREGKVDQTAGKAKNVVDDASDKVKDTLDRD